MDTSSFVSRASILLGVTVAAAVLVIPIAMLTSGRAGLVAVAFAMSVCLSSGVLAFWLVRHLRGPKAVIHQVLLGMMSRMGIPLAACLFVHFHGGKLAEAGLVYYILVFYFVTLAAETALLVNGTDHSAGTAAS
jgi:hypothetical protein